MTTGIRDERNYLLTRLHSSVDLVEHENEIVLLPIYLHMSERWPGTLILHWNDGESQAASLCRQWQECYRLVDDEDRLGPKRRRCSEIERISDRRWAVYLNQSIQNKCCRRSAVDILFEQNFTSELPKGIDTISLETCWESCSTWRDQEYEWWSPVRTSTPPMLLLWKHRWFLSDLIYSSRRFVPERMAK